MNHIEKFGYDSNKSMNEMFRDFHTIHTLSDDRTTDTRANPRKMKPKRLVKEVHQFVGNPKNWVN